MAQFVGGKTAELGDNDPPDAIALTGLSGGTDSSPSEGDLVIVAFCCAGTVDMNLAIDTAGYTDVAELYANGTRDANLLVGYKFMGASPDASVTVSGGEANRGAVAAIHVWRSVDSGTPLDVSATTATGTGTGQPNPPSITPISTGAVVIAVGGGSGPSGMEANFTQSELSNFITESEGNNDVAGNVVTATVGMGSFAWSSGAFNPAAWTGGSTDAGDSWTAISIALRSSGIAIEAEAGSFALTGADATFGKTYILGAETGSFVLTGSGANLEYGRVFSAESGSFALTGSDASLHKGFTLPVEAGTFTLTGSAATLTRNVPLVAEGGSFTLTGRDIRQLFIFKPGSSPSGWVTTDVSAPSGWTATTPGTPAEWETLL